MTVQFDNISLQMKNKIPDFQQVELCPVVKWGVLSVQYFIVRSLYLSKVQQPQEQRYPFLSVHAVCSFVQTMTWLPVFGIFNVHTDADAYDCYTNTKRLTAGESELKVDSR